MPNLPSSVVFKMRSSQKLFTSIYLTNLSVDRSLSKKYCGQHFPASVKSLKLQDEYILKLGEKSKKVNY